MNVTGWIGVGSLGVVGVGVVWTMLYNAKLALRNRRGVTTSSAAGPFRSR